jgi:SRSO17 transposase
MVDTTSNWESELGRWLEPFLDHLGHKARRRMCPLYVSGLIGPGDRKSVQPMASRLAPGDYDQLHHFIAAGVWDATPLESELLVEADRLVGGKDAVLVIDDTAMPKKGDRSVGVAPQYASSLGKTANCQTLVSLTLARGEVPVMVALRLFIPESWTNDPVRLKRAGVPVEYHAARTKPEIALAEIDRVIAAGVRFGCVLADAGYGLSAPFRQGLTSRGLVWAVGFPGRQKVYPAGVKLIFPIAGRGRPRQRHIPDLLSIPAEDMLANAKWKNVSWRLGTKGRLKARFAAVRVRIADGPPQRIKDKGQQHLPGEEVWLIGEHRSSGERTILARPSSSRTHDHDRLRVPPASPPRTSGAEKKESMGHHLSPACRPCATPSSLSSFGHQISDAHTAEDKSAKGNGVNKSAKVVLGASIVRLVIPRSTLAWHCIRPPNCRLRSEIRIQASRVRESA